MTQLLEDELDDLVEEANGFWISSLPADVQSAFKMGALAWPRALQRAIAAGIRDPDKLADIIFFMHYPDLQGRPISRAEPNYQELRKHWMAFRHLATIQLAATSPDTVLAAPTPGFFYRIRHGDTLLGIAGPAFGARAGRARLAYAKFINGYPVNRRYYVTPTSDFSRTHFPNGIISFYPRFSCQTKDLIGDLRRAKEGACYALIFIPQTDLLARSSAKPGGFVGSERGAGARPSVKGRPGTLNRSSSLSPSSPAAPSSDRRKIVDTKVPPFRWTCRIIVEFQGSQKFVGSGFLIAPDIVLTAGHNLFSIRIKKTHPAPLAGEKSFHPAPLVAEKLTIAFGLTAINGKTEKPFDDILIEPAVDGRDFAVSPQWRDEVRTFLAIPPSADHQ